MSDEDDDNIINAAPLFEDKYMRTRAMPASEINGKDEALEWMNKQYACITINGKFKILREKDNGDIEFLERKSFIDMMEPIRLQIQSEDKQKLVPLTELWLKWPKRRSYDNGITFDPSRAEHYDEMYNLWKGYKLGKGREGDCSVFLDYMKNIICAGNESDFKYLVALISQMYQEPHKKPGIIVVIRGDEGVGKSFFVEKLGELMYPYYFKASNPEYIFGDHNGQLKNKVMLHMEEAVWAGSKKTESSIKDLATGLTLQVNDKFMPVYDIPNHLHIFMTGNPDWLVAAGARARRIFALHASDSRRVDTEYFSKLDNWFFREGGAAALLHYFLNHKTDINLRIVQVTDELVHQRKHSLGIVEEWTLSMIETGDMPYGELVDGGRVLAIKNLIYQDFIRSSIGKNSKLTPRQFGGLFCDMFPDISSGQTQTLRNGRLKSIVDTEQKAKGARGIRFDAYLLPSIIVARSLIDFKYGGRSDWNSKPEWNVIRGNDDGNEDIYGSGRF
jgi:Family of unknown function (DUF5906)